MTHRLRQLSILACFAFATSCAGANESGGSSEGAQGDGDRAANCPATAPAPDPLPGATAQHQTLEYWLGRAREYGDPDEALLDPSEIAAHNRALTEDRENGLPIDRRSLASTPDAERLQHEIGERLGYLRERIASGEYVDAHGQRLNARAAATFADAPVHANGELRVALAEIRLRCGPRLEGLYKTPVDAAFDRNNCSTVAQQEPVQVLMRWPNGTQLVRTRYSLGWLPIDAPLSPPIARASDLLDGPPMRAARGTELAAEDGAHLSLSSDAFLASDPASSDHVFFADAAGLHRAPASGLTTTARPLTRRAFLEEAFRHLGEPYSWGGLDCSAFVMEVLGTFGFELPRHSARQAVSGSYTIDLPADLEGEERERLIDAAAHRGIVLLSFPGHIMIYLGRNDAGTPMAIHAFSEYVEACGGGRETIRRADRVAVSDLSLGEGSSRKSFLERIDHVVVFGRRLGNDLIGTGTPRHAASVHIPVRREECDDSLRFRIFNSPERPNSRQPLRVFAIATEDPGPVELALVAPNGERVNAEVRRLGGPPFTYWAQIDAPAPGVWTAVLGDGDNVRSCDHIGVSPGRPRARAADPNVVWTPRLRWEADTEALYSAFVEQLFDYPLTEEITWPNLTVLLQNEHNNILFDHLSQSEESRIRLQPDCADLPYFLRTYFAWKMRLPFGFRTCTRGRHGELPTCTELEHPGIPHEYTNEVDAFRWFITDHVKLAVHSASGRTSPTDSETALYPIPLTREALTPGTVFADPYGHFLMIARWVPQGVDDYGVMLGADAQPDGTIGRRRFWRGSFLFHPDVTMVGAGFKAWRPVLYDRTTMTYSSLPNERITARAGYVPFSMQQYEGTTDDFYWRMEELINPRPLDPVDVQVSLVEALEESIARRVVSVDNGENWEIANPGQPMEMPEGGAIFQTGGPWEDFATPSRDMRLLISIDTVAQFPEAVHAHPERYGLAADEVAAAVESVRRTQRRELESRGFSYRRSDGHPQQLTLADVIARGPGFEMAYNPNDCMEVRWGAPDGSPEMRSCERHAPAAQRALMDEYRSWFHDRQRPIY